MGPLDRDAGLALYRTMLRIRRFEERVTREFRTGEMPGFVHTYIGAEAVAAGVCAHLSDNDLITSTHRGHGHCIAKGCSLGGMLLELYGRETGLCKGRGGSMHIADFARGMLGANAIVGGGLALATGGGLAAQVRGTDRVAVCFFGDGAVNQGVFHESLNLAAIWCLPVVYVCENNGWAESTPTSYATSVQDVAVRADAYSIPGHVVDGADAVALYEVAGGAIARARAGEGPSLLEAKVPRLVGHFLGDPEGYRDRQETKRLWSGDPLPRFGEYLVSAGLVTNDELAALDAPLLEELDEAVAAAKAGPLPDPANVVQYVYTDVAP